MYETFITVLVVGCVIMFANLVYATVQKPSKMQIHIIVMLMSFILMFTGYYIELRATTLDMALMGTVVAYIGKPFIMLHSFMVICSFYGIKIRNSFYYAGSAIGAIIFLAVLTNPITKLYYSSYTFDTHDLHAPLLMENGPLYWLHAVTMVGYFIACAVVSIRGYIKSRNTDNARFTVYMVLMVIFGLLGYGIYLSGLSGGYDATVFGALAGVLCLSILFYRYRLFDAISVAKDSALENSITGIVVVDSGGTIAYANLAGTRLMEGIFSVDRLMAQNEEERRYQAEDRTYSVSRREIDDNGKHICTSFEINDITVSANYQSMLEKDVRERTEKIESIQRKTIASLASIVEARSLETGQHIVRTSEYSRMIANVLRESDEYKDVFTEDYADFLADVTPLHDVGKVSVPDRILLKPGRLDKDEFDEMKKHSETGAEIIEKAMRGIEDDSYVDLAIKVALYHHERWDGTGYPRGLKGNEIPIEARIMAVADCFDALVSERCYKKPMSVVEAILILKEESGTHFDPQVVEAFLKAYNYKSN